MCFVCFDVVCCVCLDFDHVLCGQIVFAWGAGIIGGSGADVSLRNYFSTKYPVILVSDKHGVM